jgi:hypothetical protein
MSLGLMTSTAGDLPMKFGWRDDASAELRADLNVIISMCDRHGTLWLIHTMTGIWECSGGQENSATKRTRCKGRKPTSCLQATIPRAIPLPSLVKDGLKVLEDRFHTRKLRKLYEEGCLGMQHHHPLSPSGRQDWRRRCWCRLLRLKKAAPRWLLESDLAL